MTLRIEIDREEDGRWIAEVPDLPGVMAYGQTRAEVVSKVEALALCVVANRIEHGETIPAAAEAFTVAV
jgi:predicted RNase H-like HicB family nuclease